jgi:6-pyruvoyltetrahydropterin/6-carboxytetrahydropterin synthase
MTVFPDGRKERLHGHNFYLSVALDLASVRFADLVDFGPIKRVLAELCAEWKERTLLAERNPHFRVLRDDPEEVEFSLCGRRYLLPREDVLLLPVDNVTVEALSAHAADLLAERLSPLLPRGVATSLEVSVEESPGQGASCSRPL